MAKFETVGTVGNSFGLSDWWVMLLMSGMVVVVGVGVGDVSFTGNIAIESDIVEGNTAIVSDVCICIYII
jgi:hypothetical protein